MTGNSESPTTSRRAFIAGSALAGLSLAGGLSACSGGKKLGGSSTGGAGNASKAELQWWTNHGPLAKPFKGAISEFEQKNPGITVKTLDIADTTQYYTKLKTAAVAKKLPDVFYVRTYDTASNASKGWNLSLHKYMSQSNMTTDDFWPAEVSQMTYNNQLYCLPYNFSDFGIYYNKKMFADAGVAPPSDSWTWDDFFNAANKFVQRKGGKVKRWGASIPFYDWFMMGMFKANGGDTFSEDRKTCVVHSSANVQVMKQIQQAMQTGALPQPGSTPEGLDPFSSSLIAMKIDGSWSTGTTQQTVGKKFDWDVAMIPKGSTGKRECSTAGGAWGISAFSTQQDAAWKFINFITSTKMQNQMLGTQGSVPGRKSSVPKWLSDLKKQTPPYHPEVFTQTLSPDNAANWLYPTFWSDFETIWNNRSQAILNGKDPDTILKQIQDDTNKAAQRNS